jgi:hypothetical protein
MKGSSSPNNKNIFITKVTNLLGAVKSRYSIFKQNITNQFKYVSNKIYNIFKLQHEPGVDSVLNLVNPTNIPKPTTIAPLLVNTDRSTTNNMVDASVTMPQQVISESVRKPSPYEKRYNELLGYYHRYKIIQFLDLREGEDVNPMEIYTKTQVYLKELETVVTNWSLNSISNDIQPALNLCIKLKEDIAQTQFSFQKQLIALQHLKAKENNELINLRSEVQALRDSVGETHVYNATKIVEYQKTITDLKDQLSNAKQQLLEEQARATYLSTTTGNKNSQVSELQDEISALHITGRTLTMEIEDFKALLAKAEQESKETRIALENARAINDEQTLTIKMLHTQKTSLEYEVNSLIAQVQQKQDYQSHKEMEAMMAELSDTIHTDDSNRLIPQLNKTLDITSKRFITLLNY